MALRMTRAARLGLAVVTLAGVLVVVTPPAATAAVPGGFADQFLSDVILNDFNDIEFLPDDRLVADERHGHLHIFDVTSGTIPSPRSDILLYFENNLFLHSETGLLGFALDPDFPSNGWIYVYLIRQEGGAGRARIERVTFNFSTNSAPESSRTLIWEAPTTTTSHVRQGGELTFDNDGYLYLSTGDAGSSANSQNLANHHGKVLRLNKDGSVPLDNPFSDGAGGDLDEVYAYGIRNAEGMAYDPLTDRLYVMDQGTSVEEINLLLPGADYGWGDCQGSTGCPAGVTLPIFEYPHTGNGGRITGGDFYREGGFGGSYEGALFYADVDQDWIRYLTFDTAGNVLGSFGFASNIGGPLDVEAGGPDDGLYYIESDNNSVRRIYSTGPVTPPGAPTNLGVVANSETQITVTWDDGATDETSFVVERSEDGGSFSEVAVIGVANTEIFVDTSVVADVEYCYRVKARKPGADSGYSNTECTTTIDAQPPVITLLGDSPLVVPLGGPLVDPRALVTDNVDPDREVAGVGVVDVNTIGSYELAYDATDAAGNTAATVTRRVDVAGPVSRLGRIVVEYDAGDPSGWSRHFLTIKDDETEFGNADGEFGIVPVGTIDGVVFDAQDWVSGHSFDLTTAGGPQIGVTAVSAMLGTRRFYALEAGVDPREIVSVNGFTEGSTPVVTVPYADYGIVPGVTAGSPGADLIVLGAGGQDAGGSGSDDWMDGRRGPDKLSGNGGADFIVGGMGNDKLFGRGDDDILHDGEGVDKLTGNQGADLFVLHPSDGRKDRIVDFVLGVDKIQLPGITSFSELTITTRVPGRVIIRYGDEKLLVTDPVGLDLLVHTDFTPADFILS